MGDEAERRIEGIEPTHRAVSHHLGDHRGGGDGRALLVSVDDRPMRRGRRAEPEAVDEAYVGSRADRSQRRRKRPQVGTVEPGAVDLAG